MLKDVDFPRPVVIFGPLADVARKKLVAELPGRFEAPQLQQRPDAKGGRSAIIKMDAIRAIIARVSLQVAYQI